MHCYVACVGSAVYVAVGVCGLVYCLVLTAVCCFVADCGWRGFGGLGASCNLSLHSGAVGWVVLFDGCC